MVATTQVPTPANDVAAIVVTYEPDADRLAAVVAAVVPQVALVLLIDNSISADARAEVTRVATAHANAELLSMAGNRGLSAAYNTGIGELRKRAALTHVLLLDQDSLIDEHMVGTLRAGIEQNCAGQSGSPVTVGPWYQDELSGRRSVVLRTSRLSLARQSMPGEPAAASSAPAANASPSLLPTEMLISSGSLIPLKAFEQLGLLDTELFIDHIDTDWSLRVRHAGLWMAVVPQASMSHRLGDRVQRVWWGGERTLPVHSPMRLYFIVRNSFWLYGRPHAHWRWILFDLKRLLAVGLVHMLAAGPRWQRLRMLGRGFLHGIAPGLLRGRSSGYDGHTSI